MPEYAVRDLNLDNKKLAIIGLGYVGLPLAVEFGRKLQTIGFDISAEKVNSCRKHIDPAGEVSAARMRTANKLKFTNDADNLHNADFIIIASNQIACPIKITS